MTNVEEIVQLLEQMAKEANGPIFGSDFGKVIVEKFPSFKEEYGGINSFITQYCKDKIKWIGKRGGNDLYTHATIDAKPEDIAVRETPNLPTPWYVFATPDLPWKLYIDCETCELKVAQIRDSIPAESEEIKTLTTSDHKKIAKDFTAHVSAEFREPLNQILLLENFWAAWLDELHINQRQNLYKWNSFRRIAITGLFKSKLSESKISDECKGKILLKFQEPAQKRSKNQAAPDARELTTKSMHSKSEQEGLRALTLRIVSKMSHDELLGLKVSMSAVYHAISSASDS